MWENPLALGEDNNLKNYFKFQLLIFSISISFWGFMSQRYLGLRFFRVNKISKLRALLRHNKLRLLALLLIISSEFTEPLWRMIVCHNVFSQQWLVTKLMKLLVVSWKNSQVINHILFYWFFSVSSSVYDITPWACDTSACSLITFLHLLYNRAQRTCDQNHFVIRALSPHIRQNLHQKSFHCKW